MRLLALALLLPGAAAAQPAPAWAVFQDPVENAFSVQVPAGWLVSGGLVRPAPGETRTVLEARSPDGTSQVGMNDKDLPTFVLPQPMYAQMGMAEGANVGGAILSRYRTGQEFAVDYGQLVFGRACGHPVKLLAQAEDAAAGQRIAAGSPIPGSTATVGDAVLQCEDPAHGFFSIVFAATTLMPFSSGGGMWTAGPVFRIAVTDQNRAEFAVAVMGRMLQTMQPDPRWLAIQQQAARQAAAQQLPPSSGPSIAAINRDLADYRRKVTNSAFHNRMVANDRVQRDVVDTINGTQRLVDPGTGTGYAAPYGYNSYSLGAPDTVVGAMGGAPNFTTPLNRTNN